MTTTPPPNDTTAGVAFGAPQRRKARRQRITGVANVLPDNSGRVGLLSYRIPENLTVHAGDAVRIPFGKRYVHGMVTGEGDPSKATRDVDAVFGVRSDPADIALANNIIRYHFSNPATVLPRLAPKTGRGADPATADPLVIAAATPRPRHVETVATSKRALLIRPPHINPAHLAAHLAHDLLDGQPHGQVLILAPTTQLVTAITATFTSGAARVDSKAPRGAWKGLCEGTVRVAVGTRTAALYAANDLAGIIVVDEEHPGHLEATQPRTHARDLAIARARALDVPLRLISAVPTPQASANATDIITVGDRKHWPTIRVLDRRTVDPVTRLLPSKARTLIEKTHATTGTKPLVIATRAQSVWRCTDCSTIRDTDTLACFACGSIDPPRLRGWDAARVRELVGDHADVISLADMHKRTRPAPAVVIFDLDALTNAAELLPGTKVATVLHKAASLTTEGGTLLVLGDEAVDHPVVATLTGPRDMNAVARHLHNHARRLGLPPFGRMVDIRVKRVHAPSTARFPGIVHGPTKVGEEWQILVRIPSADLLDLTPHIERFRRGGKCRITVT